MGGGGEWVQKANLLDFWVGFLVIYSAVSFGKRSSTLVFVPE